MKHAIIFAILAALFYSISTPISKILIEEIPSTLLAGLLYFGAGIGMTLVYSILKLTKSHVEEESLNRKDTPYVILMIVLDILAPILLMSAIAISDASSVSLMNNFEIVATSIIAFIIFKERISIKLWIGIILVTIASIILSIDFTEGIKLNLGSLFALLACACWGLENNCTRKISDKNPFQIVILKGIFSGLGSVFIGLILKEHIGNSLYIIYALILGFVAYGLSVFMYVKAQHTLGAAKTSVFYSLAPFLGVTLSFIILKSTLHFTFYIALLVMIIAMVFVGMDRMKSDNKDE